MKKIFFVTAILAASYCLLTGCSAESSTAENPEYPGEQYTFPVPLEALTTRQDIYEMVSLNNGNTYYIDAVNGDDDSGDGTMPEKAWKTLARVHSILQSGDCVVMLSGDYGCFDFETPYSKTTVYMAAEGHTPVFTSIRLADNDSPNHTAGNPATAFKANLLFYGITIIPSYVDPADSGNEGSGDPQYSGATASTYAKCTSGVYLKWFGSISFINCKMTPSDTYGASKKFLSGPAVSLVNSPDILIEGCDLDSFNSGIEYQGAPGLRVYYNYIHGVAGGMISNKDALSQDVVIEGNHLYNSNWALTDDYCPRQSEAYYYHGSFMSVRGCNTVIRNNIMHYRCNSSGVMLYDDEHIPFNNILIEGNQVYDSNNVYALRLYNVNSNVIVRNNTLISKGAYDNETPYKYNTGLALHSFLGSASGTRISIYNNVIVGRISFPGSLTGIDLKRNIVYSSSADLPEGNTVVYEQSTTYFESGFFNGMLDVSWQNWENDGEGYANPAGHGTVLDLSLAGDSPARGYGDVSLQPTTRISGLDQDNKFLKLSVIRTSSENSAGAME